MKTRFDDKFNPREGNRHLEFRRSTRGPARPWEFRIGIVPAGTADLRNQILDGMSRNGWTFVSENQGIFHFKRLKT